MSPFQPLGPHELAKRWGLTRQRVWQIYKDDLRMPRGWDLERQRVWNLEDIEAYEQVSGRKPKGTATDELPPDGSPDL